MEIAIPAFLAIVLMPFSYSITNGVGAGLIAYAVVKAGCGRWREVPVWLWPVVVLFLAYFALEPIRELFGIGG